MRENPRESPLLFHKGQFMDQKKENGEDSNSDNQQREERRREKPFSAPDRAAMVHHHKRPLLSWQLGVRKDCGPYGLSANSEQVSRMMHQIPTWRKAQVCSKEGLKKKKKCSVP